MSTIWSNLEIISDFDPEIVILQIGSNDLCSAVNTVDPQSMASKVVDDIFAMAEHTITRFKVQRIVTMQILHRIAPSRRVR